MAIKGVVVLLVALWLCPAPALARGHGQAAPAVVCNIITGIAVGVGGGT